MNGHIVSKANNGEVGLGKINQSSFDLIITDLIMPHKGGIEVLLDIKRDHPQLKVIAISGGGRTSSKNYLSISESLGANGVLAKPFSTVELIECIDRVLG